MAELRTFLRPSPAVAMVTTALMVLLTGEALGWADAKRVMANGERFLAMLASAMADQVSQPATQPASQGDEREDVGAV